MSKSLKRHFLKENEVKQILSDFHRRIDADPELLFGPKPRIELVEAHEVEIFIFDETPFSARIQDSLFPTLLFKETFRFLPKIVVDMGAVPHICDGADIMAPGIVRIDGEFDKDDLILVVDERHRKPLAIGQALVDSKTMKATKRGKIAKNVHYVGDRIWNLMRNLT